MKEVQQKLMNNILKIRYALTAAIIISLLITTGLTQYANANPGPAVNITPVVTVSGGVVHVSFISPQSFPTPASLHHYNFHSHEIAYRDVVPGTFTIDPSNFSDCENKALSPLSRHIVADGGGNAYAAFGGGPVPVGSQIHVTFDNATTDFISLQIDSGASFNLVYSPGITLYYTTGAGPVPIDPASIPLGLPVHWDNGNTGTGLREDTTGPGKGVVWLCTQQDVDYATGPNIGDLATDPDIPPDNYELTAGTFQKLAGVTVGGEILPIDMTSLFVAGAMTNAVWMVPTLGGIAGAAIALFKVKRKQN